LSKTQLLTKNFLKKFPDFPKDMNALGKFVYLRTYSRYLEKEKRRETYKETVARSVEYNFSLFQKHVDKYNIPYDIKQLRKEAEERFEAEFNLKESLSGRTKWVGGADTGVAEKYPLANFNCAYIAITKWEDLTDLFYLLLVGTGVGFKSTLEMAANMPKIRTNVEIDHIPYAYAGRINHLENSKIIIDLDAQESETAFIYVGDSKEGWVESLRLYLEVLTKPEYEHVSKITFSYNHVRPNGDRLKTFGGTASGPEPLKEMFTGFDNVLKNKIDPTLQPIETDEKGYGHVRPIHVLDMGNLVGNNVVVGGVRRTAEIFLFDPEDFESLWAKYGVNGFWKEEDFTKHEQLKKYCEDNEIETPKWFDKLSEKHYDENVNVDFVTKEPKREADGSLSPFNFGTGFYHRAMSNNSIGFIEKPSRKFLQFVFKLMQSEAEPGFINLYEAARRRLAEMGVSNPDIIKEYAKVIGLNPCAEILLWSYGVCNLTTVNAKAFVEEHAGDHTFNVVEFLEAQKRSARAGLRMTLVDLELPHWDEVQKRDRLIGTSITGWKDAVDLCNLTPEEEKEILRLAKEAVSKEATRYSKQLRVATPLLDTTVKPEGSISQVFGGVSSGLHWSFSEYFIRRIRINAKDPLAKAVLDHGGWNVNPENGAEGANYQEKMENARTYVIDFPVFSGTKHPEHSVPVKHQFDNYFNFQKNYVAHNASNSIKVRPHEWAEASEIVFDNWNDFVGVSFLAQDGGTYRLPPYESIDKEQYEGLMKVMEDFKMDKLQEYETAGDDDSSLEGMDGCENGICPIR